MADDSTEGQSCWSETAVAVGYTLVCRPRKCGEDQMCWSLVLTGANYEGAGLAVTQGRSSHSGCPTEASSG